MRKGIIVLGSSNSNGETKMVASYVSSQTGYSIVDLKTMNIGEFDYEFKNASDDFHPFMKKLVNNYEIIIFATPVYWYTMSGIMKTFFDRISDCLKTEKETGRKLSGMEMAIISSGSDRELKDGFHMPFKEAANYLSMTYIDDVHCWIENGEIPKEVKIKLDLFIQSVL